MLALGGCTTVSRSTSEAIGLLFKGRPLIEPTPEQVAAVRYPQILLRAPDIDGVVVLGYIDEGRQAWFAGRNAVFYLREDGQIVGSAGLGRTVSIRIQGENPFPHLASLQQAVTVQRRYDWMPGYRYDVPVTGNLRRVGSESIEILGHPLQLTRFEETLKGPGLSETNIYWADPATGFVWKSRQYLAPGYPVEIVQLKPYRPAKS
ncbi:MAG: YjbF family lipoprotein [Pseudomonas sp.]